MILAAFIVAIFMFSCKGDNFSYLPGGDDNYPSLFYEGQTATNTPDGLFYTIENITEVTLYRDTLYSFILHNVKFNEEMSPVTLKIRGINSTHEGSNFFFTAEEIVPLIGSTAHKEYTVTDLEANIYNGIMTFSMNCGDNTVDFYGTQVTE